jgi:hypothetical protein
MVAYFSGSEYNFSFRILTSALVSSNFSDKGRGRRKRSTLSRPYSKLKRSTRDRSFTSKHTHLSHIATSRGEQDLTSMTSLHISPVGMELPVKQARDVTVDRPSTFTTIHNIIISD